MTDLDLSSPLVVGYTGAAVEYTVAGDAPLVIDFEMWGAGGGGSYITNSGSPAQANGGGGGGNTYGKLIVEPGWSIKLEVGGAGKTPTTTASGGTGGWPDGGGGGRGLYSSTYYCCGGGGGSTRIWLDKQDGNGYVLAAIAGGGGGTYASAANTQAGPGGGSSGVAGLSNSTAVAGGGGTQSAAGTSNTGTPAAGYLQGGQGWPSGNSITTASTNAGGGGGGGYYGGGGGRSGANFFACGGGGSGYLSSDVIAGSTVAGTGMTPHDSGNKPTDAGRGGSCGTNTFAATVAPTDGAIYLAVGALDIPTSPEAVTDHTQDTIYVAQENGTVTLKVWGAGGGGATATSTTHAGQGGGGGYVYLQMVVEAGDIIKVRPGQGGNAPTGGYAVGGASAIGYGSPTSGGFGGGFGTGYSGGGGGGASGVELNDVTVVIAGGGGGGHGSGALSTYEPQYGGGGGGSTGGSGYNKTSITAYGGSQIAGGANANGRTVQNGSSLNGGKGSDAASATNNSVNAGGGGGGGYYGGAGGGTGSVTSGGGGGGGSNYVSTASNVLKSSSLQGVSSGTATAYPANAGDADYPSGVGVGGLASTNVTTAASNGGSGAVVISFEDGVPGEAVVLLPTVTITVPSVVAGGGTSIDVLAAPLEVDLAAPAATAGVYGSVVVALSTITVSGLTGADLNIYNQAIGQAIPDVEVQGNIVAGPLIDAFITIDLEAEVGDRLITAPEATVAGDARKTVALPSLSVVAVQGFMHGDDQSTGGDLETITVTEIDGYALMAWAGDIGTINLSVVEASVIGEADLTGDLRTITVTGLIGNADSDAVTASGGMPQVYTDPVEGIVLTGEGDIVGVGQPSKRVYVTAPEAIGWAYDGVAADIGTVYLLQPEAVAHTGDDVVAVGDIGTVLYEWTNTNDKQASGGGYIEPPPAYIIGEHKLFGRVAVTTIPEASSTGEAAIEVTPDLSLSVSAITGVTERAVSILAPINTVYIRKVNGYNPESPVFDGDAQGLPLDPITVTPSDGQGFSTGGAIGEPLAIIFIAPIDAEMEKPASTGGDVGEVDVTSPEAEGEGDAEASGDLAEIDISIDDAEATGEGLFDVADPLIVTVYDAEADGTGEALFDVADMPTVLISVPVADVGASAFAGGKVGYPIQVIPVAGLAFGTSGAYGSLGTVMVSPPEAGAIGDVLISGKLGTVIMACPDVTLSVGVDFEIPIDVIVTVIPPEAFGGETVFAVGEIGTVYLTVLKTSTGSFNIDEADALIREVETYLAYMEE